MDTKSQQPRLQPNLNDGPSPEQVVTGQRCASCWDRATQSSIRDDETEALKSFGLTAVATARPNLAFANENLEI